MFVLFSTMSGTMSTLLYKSIAPTYLNSLHLKFDPSTGKFANIATEENAVLDEDNLHGKHYKQSEILGSISLLTLERH